MVGHSGKVFEAKKPVGLGGKVKAAVELKVPGIPIREKREEVNI